MNTVKVLDHGFVTLRNMSGPTRRILNEDCDPSSDFSVDPHRDFDADDTDPANAARMSFDQMDSGRTRELDLRLAEYLMEHKHTGPFEMVEVWLEMRLPIFVARQFVRHRTASINEVSGRYVQLPAEWYIPALTDVVIQSKNKKQGGKPIDLADPEQIRAAHAYRERLDDNCRRCYTSYQQSIDDGIAMEQARLDLHVNHYTQWLWKQNLHNLMHFLSLRDHGHAQGEPQQYARVVDSLIRQYLPHSMALYDKYRRMS